jgi:hypothetical protein
MHYQLAIDIGDDAYDGRPGYINRTHYRIVDIATRITTCVDCRRDSDEPDDGEKRDSECCYGTLSGATVWQQPTPNME